MTPARESACAAWSTRRREKREGKKCIRGLARRDRKKVSKASSAEKVLRNHNPG